MDSPEIPSPPSPEEAVRSVVEEKVTEEEIKELVVTFPDFVQDSVILY